MEKHCENAMLVAEFLQENFSNYEIIYPGLKVIKSRNCKETNEYVWRNGINFN